VRIVAIKREQRTMNTGQTLLTIGAFIFLTTIMLNFYRLVAGTGDTIASGQDGILATTIATSYMELANGMAFDDVTDTSNVALTSPTALTSATSLRAETGEDSLSTFNDFDDFNNRDFVKQANGTNRSYRVHFDVYYVNPNDINQKSSMQTYVKRMDIKAWRVFPVATSSTEIDTVRNSLVMGYFHFN
jgi:hypothetical protein